jgi:hypothetical protein
MAGFHSSKWQFLIPHNGKSIKCVNTPFFALLCIDKDMVAIIAYMFELFGNDSG